MNPHGVTFHHFSGQGHPLGQGAITSERFEQILNFIGAHRFLPARAWQAGVEQGSLAPESLCLTFDDNLRCQYDVAVPVLDRLNMTAFFFVSSGALTNEPEMIEIYRYFRTVAFADIDSFYDSFWRQIAQSPYHARVMQALEGFVPARHLAAYPFYSDGDRTFRYVRDEVLGETLFSEIMDAMIVDHGFDVTEIGQRLWMDAACLRDLHRRGHVIGLHSHDHPTRLDRLPRSQQMAQYQKNQDVLTEILGEKPTSAAHPCNAYSAETLEILASLGVTLAFRSNMRPVSGAGLLELPRQDKTNIECMMDKNAYYSIHE